MDPEIPTVARTATLRMPHECSVYPILVINAAHLVHILYLLICTCMMAIEAQSILLVVFFMMF